jgi:hypothetical protein
MPMLEEHEWRSIERYLVPQTPFWRFPLTWFQRREPVGRIRRIGTFEGWLMDRRKKKAIRKFHQMTGLMLDQAHYIWPLRASMYGPPCPSCSKPFRTPRAKWCAACGFMFRMAFVLPNGKKRSESPSASSQITNVKVLFSYA